MTATEETKSQGVTPFLLRHVSTVTKKLDSKGAIRVWL